MHKSSTPPHRVGTAEGTEVCNQILVKVKEGVTSLRIVIEEEVSAIMRAK
jgi:hypothetical protein